MAATACSPSTATRSAAGRRWRWRTRRCCAAGRGCASGWTRAGSGCGRSGGCWPRRPSGRRRGRTRASWRAGRGWRSSRNSRRMGRPGGRLALTAEEQAYLAASLSEQAQQEAAEQERQARELALQKRAASRLRTLVAGLTIFLLVAAVLAAWAFNQSLSGRAGQRAGRPRQPGPRRCAAPRRRSKQPLAGARR